MPKAKVTNYTYAGLKKLSLQELLELRVKYAKRANQNLVRLERSQSPVTGKPYRAGAYDLAMQYLKASRDKSGGKLRFSESINYTKHIDKETGETAYDLYRIKRDVLELQTFLSSKSSTVSGSRAIEKKRVETLQALGMSEKTATSSKFYDFLNSNAYEYFTLNQFTSEEIVDIYVSFREAGMSAAKIQQAFNELKEMDMQAQENDEAGVTRKDIDEKLRSKASKTALKNLAKSKRGALL